LTAWSPAGLCKGPALVVGDYVDTLNLPLGEIVTREDTLNLMHVLVASTAAFLIFGSVAAKAKQTINEAGAISCVNDKWDVKEPEKGHKLVDYAGRCINVPDDVAAPKSTADCAGKYEYMPDGSWKGSTYTYKGGDKLTDSFEEGSHLKEYTYKNTGGTGKYEGAGGGGTYTLEELTDTLLGGRYKGTIELP
jgi:hypothetical protein